MTSKAFLHKKSEVQAVIAEEEVNLGGGEVAKRGMIIVTYPDGNRAAFSPEEFAELYEEKKPHAWPGHINLANERGHFSGTYSTTFGPSGADNIDREVNSFFANNPNLLVADVRTTPATPGATGEPRLFLTVFYTKVVSDEEINAFNRVQAKARELLDAEDAAHAEERATFVERAKKIAQERRDEEIDQRNRERELIELGEHCKKNHKKVGKK